MKGNNLAFLNLFCTEQITTVKNVTKPQNKPRRLYPPLIASALALTMSPIAAPANERPIKATVGPIITGGMSLLIQPVPANLTIIAIIT